MPDTKPVRITTKDVILALFHESKQVDNQLTDTEKAIAERICVCAACNYIWLRQKNKAPKRCPECNSPHWDLPLLRRIMKPDNVDASTSTPTEGGKPLEP
jgi:predicted Zn-ribbon and HTH transcriptional regulator